MTRSGGSSTAPAASEHDRARARRRPQRAGRSGSVPAGASRRSSGAGTAARSRGAGTGEQERVLAPQARDEHEAGGERADDRRRRCWRRRPRPRRRPAGRGSRLDARTRSGKANPMTSVGGRRIGATASSCAARTPAKRLWLEQLRERDLAPVERREERHGRGRQQRERELERGERAERPRDPVDELARAREQAPGRDAEQEQEQHQAEGVDARAEVEDQDAGPEHFAGDGRAAPIAKATARSERSTPELVRTIAVGSTAPRAACDPRAGGARCRSSRAASADGEVEQRRDRRLAERPIEADRVETGEGDAGDRAERVGAVEQGGVATVAPRRRAERRDEHRQRRAHEHRRRQQADRGEQRAEQREERRLVADRAVEQRRRRRS